MNNDEFFGLVILSWFLFLIVGTIIGSSKGRTGLGFVLCFFLGIFGVLIIACMSNLNEIARNEKENKEFRDKQLILQQIQIAEMRKSLVPLSGAVSPIPPPVPRNSTLRIGINGQDHGEIEIEVIKSMLKNDEITLNDYFLDCQKNEWVRLGSHSAFKDFI